MPITGSQPAQLMAMGGVMRGATSRGNVTTRQVFVAIDGVHYATGAADPAKKVLNDTLVITEHEGETLNTATFDTQGFQPEDGQEVVIQFGSKNNLDRLFGGRIMTDATNYVGIPANAIDRITALEYAWELTRYTITQRFTNLSATAIAKAIIALCPGWTSTRVAAGLPVVDEITFTNEKLSTALSRLAERIGGYGKGTYQRDYRFGLTTDTSETDPTEITAASALLVEMKDFRVTRDLLPVITRQPVEGNGSTALTQIQPGETILPIVDIVYFNALGGTVVSGPQRITYTGVQPGGAGSLVGTAVAPIAPPIVARIVGAGIEVGDHDYAYLFVTASGRTLPSPIASVRTRAAITAPTGAPGYSTPYDGSGTLNIGAVGGTVAFTYSYSAADSPFTLTQESAVSPSTGAQTLVAWSGSPSYFAKMPWLDASYSTDPDVKWIHLWVSVNGGTFQRSQWVQANLPAGGTVSIPGGHIVTADLVPSSGALQQVAIAGVALGPTGTTAREIVRSQAGGSQLRFQQTIANNTLTAGVTDATPDVSLGANAPTSDTSGLSIPIENGGSFYPTGVTFPTNGAATAANTASPVFTSASYTFVAADVGASVYISAGTNWIVGSYPIVSVSAGAATLAGPCASVASPTSGTWGVDYSTLAAARVAFTDMVIDGATNTQFTSAAFPVGPNYIGNVISVQAGLGFIGQRAIVKSVSGTTATCDKSLGTVSSTGGRGNMGGAPIPTTVSPGSTLIPTASAGPFDAAGGWAIHGDTLIRYQAISGNTLTGIQPSGYGSIINVLNYGDHLDPAPALSGVTGVLYTIQKGDNVNLRVVVDDFVAQGLMAARFGGSDDGIIEGDVMQDGRINETEALARGAAKLARQSLLKMDVAYTTKDKNSRGARTSAVDLGTPQNVTQSFTILNVVISGFAPSVWPTFAVTASSWRSTFAELLRRARGGA